MREYRIKFHIGWFGKRWYLVQRKYLFFWVTLDSYEFSSEAEDVLNEFVKYNYQSFE